MSVQAITWVLGVKAGGAAPKCVLLCLANYSDEQGYCWPGQQRIARETELSIDSVQRCLQKLERRKLIERKRRTAKPGDGRGRITDLYLLAIRPKPQAAVLVDQHRRGNEPTPHSCGLYIDEPSRTHRKKLKPENGTGRSSAGKGTGPDKRAMLRQAIATRIDPADVTRGAMIYNVAVNSQAEDEQLCARQSRGTLDDLTIIKLRERGA